MTSAVAVNVSPRAAVLGLSVSVVVVVTAALVLALAAATGAAFAAGATTGLRATMPPTKVAATKRLAVVLNIEIP